MFYLRIDVLITRSIVQEVSEKRFYFLKPRFIHEENFTYAMERDTLTLTV